MGISVNNIVTFDSKSLSHRSLCAVEIDTLFGARGWAGSFLPFYVSRIFFSFFSSLVLALIVFFFFFCFKSIMQKCVEVCNNTHVYGFFWFPDQLWQTVTSGKSNFSLCPSHPICLPPPSPLLLPPPPLPPYTRLVTAASKGYFKNIPEKSDSPSSDFIGQFCGLVNSINYNTRPVLG